MGLEEKIEIAEISDNSGNTKKHAAARRMLFLYKFMALIQPSHTHLHDH